MIKPLSPLTLKRLFVHLLLMALLVMIVLGAVLLWLRVYTNHGQQLELRDYVGMAYEDASKDADKQTFEMIVKDSIHKVGKPGGIILSQNPPGGSLVKENRKLYVDITKYTADEIALASLSPMYGRQYNSKVNELSYLDIKSKIKGYRHDAGEPDHILEVWYDGRLIDGESGRKTDVKIKKGATLEFLLSKTDGGEVSIPDLVCMQFNQVGFVLHHARISIGGVEQMGAITNKDKSYIIAQDPPYEKGRKIRMGEKIVVTIQQEEPESCK